jgi:hypothetical protein
MFLIGRPPFGVKIKSLGFNSYTPGRPFFILPGVSSKKVRAGLKPDTRHLKPILRKGFTASDNVQKKELFS